MEVKTSDLTAGDVILVRGMFLAFPLNLVTRYFTKGFRHSALHYGGNERGEGLVLECIIRCGPTISPMSKYRGEEIEVWRINHPLADVFIKAILKAGEQALTKKFAFFDWPLIFFRAISTKLGFSGRINHKYYPSWFCSEYVQIECFEKAAQYIDREFVSAYKKAVLEAIPKPIMVPIQFRNLPFLEKVKEGKFAG